MTHLRRIDIRVYSSPAYEILMSCRQKQTKQILIKHHDFIPGL